MINLFNYIDRYILAVVVPDVQRELLPASDANADFKMGLLSTAFLVVYMLGSPVFGVLADRTSRWRLIAIGVTLWSLASGASGLATGFAMLLITRCFVGIGEAAYGPVAPTVISDLYPVSRRGQVLSWFYVAIPVGSALGYALGGQVAAMVNWRWAFYLVVAPGVLLGLWALRMREPPRGGADTPNAPPRRAQAKDYLLLLHTPSYVLNTLGMTAMTFAIGAISWWMPKYLVDQHVAPVGGLVPSVFLGLLTVVAGLVATLAGGLTGDWLRPRIPSAYFLVSGVGLLLTVPCIIAFLLVPFPTGLGVCFPGRVLPVLQHRADQHDPGQRDTSVDAGHRVRREHSRDPPVRRRHFTADRRRDFGFREERPARAKTVWLTASASCPSCWWSAGFSGSGARGICSATLRPRRTACRSGVLDKGGTPCGNA